MSELAIRVDGLSKQYRIGIGPDRSANLQEALLRAITGPVRRLRDGKRSNQEEVLWALRDVSFDLRQGEVLGVIGRNGAGKSTLLKILSRITGPTSGEVEVRGRLASLLEVGTGFHPELTGRENIFLNGAMLGMRRREISQKFDAIVDFSGVERFLETPVKRYSSGMYMRLAFAVAAHLEPEVLVVDEVLAVGDLSFQKKCLGKMGEVARAGRTVLFVSHQMNAVRRLCHRCLWLEQGQVRMLGDTAHVVSFYEAAATATSDSADGTRNGGPARFLRWEIRGADPDEPNVLRRDGNTELVLHVQVNRPIRFGEHGIALFNGDGQLMWANAARNLHLEPGHHEICHAVPYLPLRPGSYSLQVSIYEDRELLDFWHATPELILATPPCGHPSDEWAGVLNLPAEVRITSKAPAVSDAEQVLLQT